MQSIEKLRGFLNYQRNPEPYRDPIERLNDWKEINPVPEVDVDVAHTDIERKVQAARCMDCGTPFCQTHTGCPVNNLIPEWNNLVYQDQWDEAMNDCIPPTTFQNSQAVSALRLVKDPVWLV